MRIPTLLQKISDLVEQTERPGVIEVDLMLDYTRVLYADLLEWRTKLAAAPIPTPLTTAPPVTPPLPAASTRPVPMPAAAPVSKPATTPPTPPVPSPAMPPIHEPTLAELAAAMDKQLAEEEEEVPVPVKPEAKAPPAHHIPRTATKPAIMPDREDRPAKPADPVTPPPQVKPVVQADATAVSSQAAGTKPAAPVQPAQNGKDIRSLISINDKYQIMSELFGNDKDAYEAALNHINNSGSEAAAIKWLQDTLWVTEERSDAVQNFYDLVNRYFRV